jgi:6-phosphofructokinase 1
MKKVGILTGGGDAPGLNPVIRGVVTRLAKEKGAYQVIGLLDGWKGLRDGLTTALDAARVEPIISEGGTILGSSRTNLFKKPEDRKKAGDNFKRLELDCLIAVGGDDTLEIAYYLNRDEKLNTIGVPKTIDNDVLGTDFTFGFWSAVEKATAMFDDLRTTTCSHHRVMVIECMGRHAGWITAYAGLAGGADFTAVPEKAVKLDDIVAAVKRCRERGKLYSIIAVAEGASIGGLEAKPQLAQNAAGKWEISAEVKRDAFGNAALKAGEVADAVASAVEKATGFECRGMALGHLQRGGSPAAYDRILGTMYGFKAAEAVIARKFGHMVVVRNGVAEIAPMAGNLRENQTESKCYKHLPAEFVSLAENFFS